MRLVETGAHDRISPDVRGWSWAHRADVVAQRAVWNYKNANYSVAKAGTLGLSNVAALEGAEHNVQSNVIIPAAATRMSELGHVAMFNQVGRR